MFNDLWVTVIVKVWMNKDKRWG